MARMYNNVILMGVSANKNVFNYCITKLKCFPLYIY